MNYVAVNFIKGYKSEFISEKLNHIKLFEEYTSKIR